MGVLFGCGQGVVFVPEIDSGKLAPMRISQRKLLNNVYCFVVVVFLPSSCRELLHYSTEIPLPCMLN